MAKYTNVRFLDANKNIMLVRDEETDELYLVDFGISRFYNSGQGGDTELLGTRDYAAPEQFGFGQSTNRTDIYAIGMVMLTLLYGDRAPVNTDKIEKRVMSDIKMLSVISRCTEVDPGKRCGSVGKLPPAPPSPRSAPFSR